MSEHNIDWGQCVEISDQCQEEIENFFHDGTNDNAVCLIRKVAFIFGEQQAETIKQLEARVGRLESQIIEVLAYKGVLTEKQLKSLDLALRESSQQSLAAIKAEAVLAYDAHCTYEFETGGLSLTAEEWADQLRQQADKG